ncbi:MAG: DUF6340 family protein [Bacteroidales bacterium]|nr:DUF6340 family protein [Bacteroidales bacterium]
MKKIHLSILTIVLLITGCSSARISFDTLAPSPVYIPSDIKNVTVINRTVPENSEVNRIEGIITGEGEGDDIAFATLVTAQLTDNLNRSDRFSAGHSDKVLPGSGIGGVLPYPLPWEMVTDLCNESGTDALIALESYDSDFTVSAAPAMGANALGIGTAAKTTVRCGFRFYYPSERIILDEFIFSHQLSADNTALPVLGTINSIARRKEAIMKASSQAGSVYASRVLPNWILTTREYYKKGKGNPDLETGARMMELNRWNNAIESLSAAMESGHRKVRGRAAHNLAIVYEILGDLNNASEWAAVAWGEYREKRSREYSRHLRDRINQQRLLEQQLNE